MIKIKNIYLVVFGVIQLLCFSYLFFSSRVNTPIFNFPYNQLAAILGSCKEANFNLAVFIIFICSLLWAIFMSLSSLYFLFRLDAIYKKIIVFLYLAPLLILCIYFSTIVFK